MWRQLKRFPFKTCSSEVWFISLMDHLHETVTYETKNLTGWQKTQKVVADPGEGPRDPVPLIFRPNWGRKGPQFFFLRPPPPLSQGLDDRGPFYLKVWIRHWRGRKNRGYIIHKANILSLQGPTTLFAIQQGGFCTLGGFVQETQ